MDDVDDDRDNLSEEYMLKLTKVLRLKVDVTTRWNST